MREILQKTPLALLVFLLLVSARAATAQTRPAGGLQGTVKDQTGGVLVDVPVKVNGPSGERRIKTDKEGTFALEDLRPGKYSIMVTAPGFSPYGSSVTVKALETAVFEAILKVGVTMSVDVTEPEGASLDPRKNKSALVLTGKALDALPSDPKQLMARLLAMAGATRRGDVAVYVDGFRDFKRFPPKEAIEMIRINSNPFSAEFAEPGETRIEITTKPGSDSFHGQIRTQARSSELDARNALAQTKERNEYRNVNGYLQGPLKKDRIGFMLYGGHWDQDENTIIRATVLDPSSAFPIDFAATVPTPVKMDSMLAKLDLTLAGQPINMSYSTTNERASGQGLGSGLELPEFAFGTRKKDSVGRLWWTRIGRSTLTDFRVEVSYAENSSTPTLTTPAVVVLDAFSMGGNPSSGLTTKAWATQTSSTFTMLRGKHTFKTGFLWQTTDHRDIDRTGFNGAFTFGADVERDGLGRPIVDAQGLTTSITPIERYRRTLMGLPGYAPSQFSVVAGDPSTGVRQWNLGVFVLDDWSISERVSISYGVRQDSQNNIDWRPNVAPRVAFSWLLDEEGDSALKLGAGLFFKEVEPGITLDTKARDGVRQRFIVRQPDFFPGAPAPESLAGEARVSAALYTKSPDLRVPRSMVLSATFERQLPLGLFGVLEYQYVKGDRLLRLRNLADPDDAPILQFESTGRSIHHEVRVGLRLDATEKLSFYGDYRIGRLRSDTDDSYSIPSNSMDLAADFGTSSADRRHQISTGFTASLPWRISLDASLYSASGQPFNITTGKDDNGDSYFLDRPAFANAGDPGAIVTPYGTFNPNPGPGDTIIPRNYGREPWQTTLDLSLSKGVFNGLSLGIYAQNVLNTTNLIRYSGVLTSGSFGSARQAMSARRFQFSLTYGF